MKKLIFLPLLILCSLNSAGQISDSLGWKGTPVIQLNSFTDPGSWHPNSSAGDNCYVSTDLSDTTSICLHWKFNPGSGHRYAQMYFIFDVPVSMYGDDIFGFDIKGRNLNDNCTHNLDIQLKLESLTSSANASFSWHNLARIERWCNSISALKKQFRQNSIDWNNIRVVSLEIDSDSDFSSADSGIVCFRGLKCDNTTGWERQSGFSALNNSSSDLTKIKKAALDSITGRQSASGLLYTWREDGSSWLYGQGLALKVLSLEGWGTSDPDSAVYQNAARKLAAFLACNQNNMGFWPRAWRSATGQIIVNLEGDGSVWLGDFPWAITGLANYYKKSRDTSVLASINKARRFLTDSLITQNGRLFTLQKTVQNTYIKKEVTSVEAYNAVILGLLELNDTARAVSLAKYIDSATWDSSMKYWNESIGNPRAVLFANTWFSQLIRNNKCISDAIDPELTKSAAALTFAGRVLYTEGPGQPAGFDGIGPVATWLEGTFSYISAGGQASQSVFNSLIDYISPGYAVPHYNDVISCDIGGIWAVKWISLDGTSWLWYAASKNSPFHVTNEPNVKFPVLVPETDESRYLIYPNPSSSKLIIETPFDSQEINFTLFDFMGNRMLTKMSSSSKTEFDVSGLKPGTYIVRIVSGNKTKILTVIRN